jgi:endonuclease/exonuclease/phosphatase family metal-dependent hydrolase
MPRVRIATFNVENLYSRPVFWDGGDDNGGHQIGNVYFKDPAEGRTARRIAEATLSDDKCQLTARALLACGADIVCLQEVDNAAALQSFRRTYLDRLDDPVVARSMKAWHADNPGAGPAASEAEFQRQLSLTQYRHARLVEGNDGRGIDVAVLSRLPIASVVTHHTKTFAELGVWPEGMDAYEEKDASGKTRKFTREDRIFKRDCLEVNFEISGRALTLFICHFKSMSGGRAATRVMREAEAEAVRAIVTRRFGGRPEAADWAVCGDLNDYLEIDGDPSPVDLRTGQPSPAGILPLLRDGFAENIAARLPAEERWTTYHAPDDSHTQLDYILLSPALAGRNRDARPDIIRIGQPFRVPRYGADKPRLPRVGWDRPKASDHCPIAVTLELG